jgi:hypothetical protein
MKVKSLFIFIIVSLLSAPLSAQGTSSNYFAEFFNVGDIDAVISKGMVQMQKIAWIIAIVVFLLSFGFGYLQSGVASLLNKESSGGFFKADNLFYSLFILILLGAYSPIAATLESSINYINSISEVDSQDIANLANNTQFKDQQIRAAIWAANQNEDQELKKKGIIILDKLGVNEDEFRANEDKYSTTALIDEKDWMDKLAYFMDLRNWPTIVFGAMGQILMGIIRGVVLMFTFFYFKLLFLLGPFAFAFAVNKRFQDLITDWLGAVLSTGLVFTTMNIIDYMHSAIMKSRMANHNQNIDLGAQSAFEIVFNLGFIILYLSAFKLTKTFVPGKGLGAAMVGKTIALGAAAVGATAMAAGGAAAASGGGKAMKNLSDITSKATSAFRKNDE